MYDIDNNSYKVLKEIYNHSPNTKAQLAKRFKSGLDEELNLLSLKQLIDNPATKLGKDNNVIVDYDTFFITQSGKAYIDARTKDEKRWMIPIAISAIAIFISIVALFKP